MEKRLNRIKRFAKRKEGENWRFRSFLKSCGIESEEMDAIVHRLYREVSAKIDCKACANCCKEALPLLDEEDMERLTSGLGISTTELKEQYLVEESNGKEYTFNKMPCPFLKDNLCSCYDYRPENCISYPHIHKRGFKSRLMRVIDNCSVCPIVYNVYEELKREIR